MFRRVRQSGSIPVSKKVRQNKDPEKINKMRANNSGPRVSLPYKLASLTWDKNHLVNNKNIYCYCAGPGDWFWKMIQCHRCKQWFHEECVRCLKYSLILGDRFYMFVCAVCNSGKEYVKRLHPNWDDVTHLTLFYLSMRDHVKYIDVNDVVVPWIEDNWQRLQLPQRLDISPSGNKTEHIRRHVMSTLMSHHSKYQSGKESKKRFSLWGLRVRFPPFPPHISPLPDGPVTHEMVLQTIKNSSMKRLHVADELKPVPFCYAHQKKTVSLKRKANDEDFTAPQSKRHRYLTGNRSTSDKLESANQDYKGYSSTVDNYSLSSGFPSQQSAASDSPAKISLDHVIPCPSNFYGVNHPFKTVLERDQELEHVKMKERILNNYSVCNGALDAEGIPESVSDTCTDSHAETESDSISLATSESVGSEPNISKQHLKLVSHNLPKIKRRKRGRPSKAEIQALKERVAAAIKMGVTDSNYIVQSKNPSASSGNTPKAERKKRTKNVVDKSTLDGMSEKEVSISQLKSYVNNYFGAANRLANGEGFRVLARRITPEGKCQYLVEWEGGIVG